MYQFIFLLLFVSIGLFVEYLREKKMKLSKYKLKKSIKLSFEKIEISKKKIAIVTNEFFSEIESNSNISIKTLDSLYNSERNIHYKIKYASAIVCKDCIIRGKTCTFTSNTIELSKDEILGKLVLHDKILIYFNQNNLKEYYFDLSFLI